MTNADWWTRVVQARTQRDDLRPHREWALRKDGRQANRRKAVPGIGAAIVLTVDGELRRRGCSGHTSRRNSAARSRTTRTMFQREGGPEQPDHGTGASDRLTRSDDGNTAGDAISC